MSSIAPSNEQLQYLLEYMLMENHSLFARKQIPKLGVCGVEKYRQMWSDLSGELNGIGPANKTPEQWEKCWDTIRLDSKEAMRKYLYNSKQTGEHNTEPPSKTVTRVCSLFGSYGVGFSLLPEVGIYEDEAYEEHYNDQVTESDVFDQLYNKDIFFQDQNDVNEYFTVAVGSQNQDISVNLK